MHYILTLNTKKIRHKNQSLFTKNKFKIIRQSLIQQTHKFIISKLLTSPAPLTVLSFCSSDPLAKVMKTKTQLKTTRCLMSCDVLSALFQQTIKIKFTTRTSYVAQQIILSMMMPCW